MPPKKNHSHFILTLITKIQFPKEVLLDGGQCEIICVNWIVKSITLLISESF